MSAYKISPVAGLHDPITGALVGFLGADNNEYLFPDLYGPGSGFVDASATPGAATLNTVRGNVAIAAGASSVVITNALCKTTSTVFAVLQSADATLTQILRVVPGNGSFTITGNANATAAATVGFLLEK